MRKKVLIIAMLIGACGFMSSMKPISIALVNLEDETCRSVIELMLGSNVQDLRKEIVRRYSSPFYVSGRVPLYVKDPSGKFRPFADKSGEKTFDAPLKNELEDSDNTLYFKIIETMSGDYT